MFSNYEKICIFILFISFLSKSQENGLEPSTHNGIKKNRKFTNFIKKNEVLDLFKIRRICMDVCNPPYFAQEYPASYGNQNGQYYPSGSYGYDNNGQSQNYPFGSYGYGQSQNYPFGGNGYGSNVQSQNYPFGSYGYGSYDDTQSNLPGSFGYGGSQYYPSGSNAYELYNGIQNYYPQNQFGEYYPWCYRDMFRKKYNIDPGTRKPRVFHYKKFIHKKRKTYKINKNYNYNQDYINCQRICYPLVIPETVSTKSTAKVTRTKTTTKITRSTTVSSTSTETSDDGEATLSPPEKPDSSTMLKPADVEYQSTQPSASTSEISSPSVLSTQKPEAKSKRKGKPTKHLRMVLE
ncbi:hypothetical protein WA026_021937 [Henosepilachna vigintioctopunctata]|uniref:Uncharacterized protein n=1 Tax=Henosepilachna vigintioctopunctata TaxID=420089 RepID=A0AAW1VJ59_9CUCU